MADKGWAGQTMAEQAILVTGSNGQVGWELQRALSPLGRLVLLDRACCDLADPEALRGWIREVRPAAIVNAAAYTAVDQAESESDLAAAVNAQAVRILAEEAKAVGAWLIHYSTDYVFDGSGERPWREEDPIGPKSVYGATKLEGEQAIIASGAAALIFRTSWVFGVHGHNFLKTMLKVSRERPELKVVADQMGAPTPAHLIADVTAHALRDALNGRIAQRGDIFHLAPRGATSWHAYAELLIEHAKTLGWPIKTRSVHAITSSEWPTPAARPANSRLDCRKLEATFGLRLPEWEAGVKRVVEQVVQKPL
ncbi:dTDP-4-dehydrorhamnose reductase [Thioalkalivibrio thiocyanoxidans]|uniref:dTDP-4-dehydrorhamnose reductase n=1 Tax=Thioalkalivibrio thiocyanoxidans TaxID=152475 RepID=UPI00036177EC|nr:dTDP-4-dehydrorhamnose reductase [Thioalkalivibrio thiocyanoxidans]